MDDISISVEIPGFSGIDLTDDFLADLEDVLADVASERGRQIKLGYDAAHDDAHSLAELEEQFLTQLHKARSGTGTSAFRESLVQAAAVAVAAVQSFDRRRRRAAVEAVHG